MSITACEADAFESMLDDLRAFLVETTRAGEAAGEIVYVNLSHYLGFANGADCQAFGDLVYRKVGDFRRTSILTGRAISTPPPQEITGQGGEYKSQVILVSENPLSKERI